MRVLQCLFLGCVLGLGPAASAARGEDADKREADGLPADVEPGGGAVGGAVASPEPAPTGAPVVAVTLTAQAEFEEAVRRYQFGEGDAAQGMFAALALDDEAPASVRQEARLYLGELLYVAGDKEEARRFFEQVLRQDPEYAIDAFIHPPEVVGFFNYVRAYQASPPEPGAALPLPQAPTLVPPSPFSAMVGHGVYHFRYGKPGRGVLYLGLQGGFLAVDAVLWAGLLSDRSYEEGDEAERTRLNRNRTLTGVMAVGYWGTWLTSAVDANLHWRRVEGPARARAASTPTVTLPPVQVRGTF